MENLEHVEKFAARHRLNTRVDVYGGKIVPGKRGQIYEWGTNPETGIFELGVMFLPPPTPKDLWGRWCPKTWGNCRRAGLAIGMNLRQNGDSEGCLSFDPGNPAHVKLALKIAKVHARRKLSPEARAKAVATLERIRQQPA